MSQNTRTKPKSRQAKETHRQQRAKTSTATESGKNWRELPESGNWAEWVKYLAARPEPATLAHLLPSGTMHPLKWALPDEYEAVESRWLLKQLIRLSSGKKFAAAQIVSQLSEWLEHVCGREPDSTFALEALAWCHALPRLSQMVPEGDWRAMLGQLEEIVGSAAGMAVHDHPIAHPLLNGELPLALAYTFPEFTRFQQLVQPASAALSFGAVELLDGEGLPNARQIGGLRTLLACWTRCWFMSSAAEWDVFDPEASNQFAWLVRQALRLSRSDGTLIMSRGLSGDWCVDLFAAALQAGDDKSDQAIARLVLPGNRPKMTARQLRGLPEPSVYSEWSEACVMRSRWSHKSPQFSCFFNQRQLRCELSTAGRLVWSGDCQPSLRVEGRELNMTSDWTELCWFTDEDVDYLELEAEYAGGWVIQRQMLLARADDILLMADAVLGPHSADLQYDAVFPLVDDVRYEPEGPTRDGYLVGGRPLCTVVPLSLAEWTAAPSHGRLEAVDNRLHLRIHESAQRLYAPLLFDLALRPTEKRTWRQLTVAEQLVTVPRDVAAGYRIQLGKRQWLVYRSLAPQGNRSVLGQNLVQEFLLARFDLDGGLEELLEIE